MKIERRWSESKIAQKFHDPSDYSMAGFSEFPTIPWFIFGNALGGPLVGVSAFSFSATVGWSVLSVFLLVFNLIPNLWRFSPLCSIDNNIAKVGGNVYYYRNDGLGSADLLRKVLRLSQDDQRLFPSDLPRTLSQNLHRDDREKINQSIHKTLKKIDERDKHLATVKARAIPTEHVLAALEDAQNNLDSDIKVYKEFL